MARFLGIDIGSTTLRGVLIRNTLRKLEVERYVEVPLAEPPQSPARLPELLTAGRNLRRLLGAAPFQVVAAVAGEHASLRVVNLPAAAKKRIAEVLPFELEAVLPYDPHEAVIDYQIIDSSKDELRVLAASVLQKHVAATLEELRHAELEPSELAAGATALDGLLNLAPALHAEGPFLLIDFSDHRIDLCLLHNGRAAMARTLGFGIQDMPGAAEAAERELQRTLASFRGAGFAPAKAVYLCGEGCHADGAIAWLSRSLGQEVTALVLPDPKLAGTSPAPAFGKAAALAARAASAGHRIDLRKGGFTYAAGGGNVFDHAGLIAICMVAVIVTAMFSLKANQKLLADENQALRDELTAVTKNAFGKAIDDPSQVEALVQNPTTSDPLPRFDAYDALGAVSTAISPEISHEVRRLHVDLADQKRGGQLELQGALGSLGERDAIVGQLSKHPCFRNIELGRTTPAGSENRINYQIEATLLCPGEVDPKDKKRKKAEVEL